MDPPERLISRIIQINEELRKVKPLCHNYKREWVMECGCYLIDGNFKCDTHLNEELDVLRANYRVRNAKNKDPRSAEVGTEYAFTLTMPPDYQPANPLPEVAKKILEFGLTNKPYEKATEYAYVLEHTEKGTPHIHGVYRTASGRRISSKYFKRYWPLWTENSKEPGYKKLGNGFIGGYHQKARHSESYKAYLEKEGAIIKSSPEV